MLSVWIVAGRALTSRRCYIVPAMETLPRQIGPFRVLRHLGRGGMADVFLAVAHGASGFERRVAVKTLLPALQGDPDYERALIDEARIAARFHHRNLVQVHDLGVAQGTYWVRMDLVEGTDLATLLARGPLSAPLALFIDSPPHVDHVRRQLRRIVKFLRALPSKKRLFPRLFEVYSKELMDLVVRLEHGIDVYNVDDRYAGDAEAAARLTLDHVLAVREDLLHLLEPDAADIALPQAPAA